MPIFFIFDDISESKMVFRGFMVYIIQRQHFICLHHSQLQEMPSNGEGSFCSGRKNISLWRSEEKRTVTALARRGETLPPRTAPAGGRTACWRGPGCPPAQPPASSRRGSSVFIWCIFNRPGVAGAVLLTALIQIFCLLFGVASSSRSSRKFMISRYKRALVINPKNWNQDNTQELKFWQFKFWQNS